MLLNPAFQELSKEFSKEFSTFSDDDHSKILNSLYESLEQTVREGKYQKDDNGFVKDPKGEVVSHFLLSNPVVKNLITTAKNSGFTIKANDIVELIQNLRNFDIKDLDTAEKKGKEAIEELKKNPVTDKEINPSLDRSDSKAYKSLAYQKENPLGSSVRYWVSDK